ncbi:MAG: divergent PAP2 family protein [Candidatus Saccharimonadales bacterium]
MDIFSPYIIAAALAWLVAQGAKYLVASIRGRSFKNLRQLYLSGSMPSAHSASVVALVMVIGVRDGGDSGLFGLAILFAAIVMYDAVMVRRSSGEQGKALTELIKEKDSKVALPRVAKGHTPQEVMVGALVGMVVGVVVALATL